MLPKVRRANRAGKPRLRRQVSDHGLIQHPPVCASPGPIPPPFRQSVFIRQHNWWGRPPGLRVPLDALYAQIRQPVRASKRPTRASAADLGVRPTKGTSGDRVAQEYVPRRAAASRPARSATAGGSTARLTPAYKDRCKPTARGPRHTLCRTLGQPAGPLSLPLPASASIGAVCSECRA